ncbi:MAG: hypothetical protein SFT92_02320 [Rickettsiales bacterium]|nr:hypothetical protein [Rickettsiales bacterium]
MVNPRHDAERLAVLEERTETHRAQIDALLEALKTLTREVTLINHQLSRNLGFLGGVAFVFSLFGACIGAFGAEIIRRL